MDKEKLIAIVKDKIQNNQDYILEYIINKIPYKIIFQRPDYNNGINISSVVAIPIVEDMSKQIVLESNNLESDNFERLLDQAIDTGMRLIKLTNSKPSVILVPLIPSYKDAPYFQQLSKDCFELSLSNKNYRMDEQIVRLIGKTKEIVKKENGSDLEDKIFINGYSCSGVFAQRFSLIHPELVNACCIGGASGSIPIPTKQFGYPIGILDYKELFGKEFDMDSYKQIDFTYYVGEFELNDKSNTRYDERGNPAPMHDMSYFERSVPKNVGKNQREALGTNMFDRVERTIEILNNLGVHINHNIVTRREHNNKNGIGINEIGDKIIVDTYRKFTEDEIHMSYK